MEALRDGRQIKRMGWACLDKVACVGGGETPPPPGLWFLHGSKPVISGQEEKL